MEKTNAAAEGEQEVGDTSTVDQDVDFCGSEQIDEGPYVVAVHQSQDDDNTLVARGNVVDIREEDAVVVPLQPVGDSNLTGVAMIGRDDGSFSAWLWHREPLEQAEHMAPAPTPESRT